MASTQQAADQQSLQYEHFNAHIVPFTGDYAWLQGLTNGLAPTKQHPCPDNLRPDVQNFFGILAERLAKAGQKEDGKNKYGNKDKPWLMPNAEQITRIRNMLWKLQTGEVTQSDQACFRHKCKEKFVLRDDGGVVTEVSNGCEVPLVAREHYYRVLLHAHVDPASGVHYGRDTTYQRVRAWFNTRGLSKDLCWAFVQACPQCQQRKSPERDITSHPKTQRATTENNGVQKRAPKAKKSGNTALAAAAASAAVFAGTTDFMSVYQGQYGQPYTSAAVNDMNMDADELSFSSNLMLVNQDPYSQSLPAVGTKNTALDPSMFGQFDGSAPQDFMPYTQSFPSAAANTAMNNEMDFSFDDMEASCPVQEPQCFPSAAANTPMDLDIPSHLDGTDPSYQGQYAQREPTAATCRCPQTSVDLSPIVAYNKARSLANAGEEPASMGNLFPSPAISSASFASAPTDGVQHNISASADEAQDNISVSADEAQHNTSGSSPRCPSAAPAPPTQPQHGDNDNKTDFDDWPVNTSGDLDLFVDPTPDWVQPPADQGEPLDIFGEPMPENRHFDEAFALMLQ